MDTVGAYEAKTHLSKLLARVAKGDRIVIEKHGVPIATLVPANPSKREPADKVIAELKRFRASHSLGDLSLREMIEEGRR